MGDTPHPPERDRVRKALAYSQMGLQLALTAGLGVFLGLGADRRWGCSPWGLLAGLLLGAGVGMTVFILEAMNLSRDEDDEHKEKESR